MVLVQAIGVGGGVVVSIARLWRRRRRNGSSTSTALGCSNTRPYLLLYSSETYAKNTTSYFSPVKWYSQTQTETNAETRCQVRCSQKPLDQNVHTFFFGNKDSQNPCSPHRPFMPQRWTSLPTWQNCCGSALKLEVAYFPQWSGLLGIKASKCSASFSAPSTTTEQSKRTVCHSGCLTGGIRYSGLPRSLA